MPASPRTPVAWTQPPLFEPDWIVLEFRLNVSSDNDVVWGGVYVSDGFSGEALMITAAPMREGVAGLRDALEQMYAIAAEHLQNGAPFAP
jgi:hypothetical protein